MFFCPLQNSDISIHSLLTEGDLIAYPSYITLKNFNPLPPHRGRPTVSNIFKPLLFISIHSLLTEGDMEFCNNSLFLQHFNPLPPHRGRQNSGDILYNTLPFQSTPSSQRETFIYIARASYIIFQSTPSSQRETHEGNPVKQCIIISIHSLSSLIHI